MSACPCCLEDLKPAFMGLGGRRLAGGCEVCGERVCESCLRAPTLRAGDFRARRVPPAESRRKVKGLACLSCLWELLRARGMEPPFSEPAGHRQRAAQQTCDHPRLVRWMRCCPECGAEVGWQSDPNAPRCDACGAPSHDLFNACWACGESFEEENDPHEAPAELGLDHPCTARECRGRVAWPMRYCPWCAEAQRWPHTIGASAMGCVQCDTPLEPTWAHCTACGAVAPPPERCVECGDRLEEAACAARCEECRHLVCADCFGDYALPADPEGQGEALLLCTSCAEDMGAVPVSEELGDEAETDVAGEDELDGDEAVSEPDDGPADGSDPRARSAAEAAAEEQEEDRAEPGEEPAPDEEDVAAPPTGASAWEVLGVAPGTPLAEVRRAYLTLVAQYHPDKVAQLGPKLQALALEETRRLNQAWSELRERAG